MNSAKAAPCTVEASTHNRLGGMIVVGVARPGWAVGFHVELIPAALSGPFRRPGACVTPSPLSE